MKKNYSKVMLTKIQMQSTSIMESSSFGISETEITNDTQLGARRGGNTAISDLDLL